MGSVHKGVHEGRRQVRARTVHGGVGRNATAQAAGLYGGSLVHLLGGARSAQVQVADDGLVEFGQVGVANQLVQLVVVFQGKGTVGPRQNECHLAALHGGGAELGREQFGDFLVAVDFDRHAQCIGVFLLGLVNRISRVEQRLQVVGVGDKLGGTDQIQTHALVVALVYDRCLDEFVQLAHFNKEIHCFGFRVVLHLERNNVVH
mmetsp:Transcript_44049/g.76780  ORF Transcript_44049/g.76780 Transcript_44049/m.76780 type:complete len:204 (-) Transcript_44049:561-1172(-)